MARLARLVIGLSFAVFAIEHFVYADFVTRVVPKLPAWIPWQPFLAYVTGILLIAGAIGIAIGKRRAALMLGAFCLASALLLHLPRAVTATQNFWTQFGKGMTLAGTCFIVAASLSTSGSARDRLNWCGKIFLGGFLILCGVQHFIFVAFVASLIPPWIPWHVFWTYFAGVALIAGGIGMLIPITTWLATLLSGIMILAWVPLVHIPLAIESRGAPGQLVPVFEALMFGTVAVLAVLTSSSNQSAHPSSAQRQVPAAAATS